MSHYEILDHKQIDSPVLVVATEGWLDAGNAVTIAVTMLASDNSNEYSRHILSQNNLPAITTINLAPDETSLSDVRIIATFDDDFFLDRRARRPIIQITDGVSESPMWPATHMLAGKDLNGKDICYLVGPEPDFHWNEFVNSILSICNDLGVSMAVGLGAFPAPVPHTRPVRLAATAQSNYSDLARKIGVVRGTIQVPSGIWGILEHAIPDLSIPAIGLWARVPHYVASMPFSPASLALVNGLCEVTNLSLPTNSLMAASDKTLNRINDMMNRSEEHSKMVQDLEQRLDGSEGNPLDIGQVPTGDEIATELERYLHISNLLDQEDDLEADIIHLNTRLSTKGNNEGRSGNGRNTVEEYLEDDEDDWDDDDEDEDWDEEEDEDDEDAWDYLKEWAKEWEDEEDEDDDDDDDWDDDDEDEDEDDWDEEEDEDDWDDDDDDWDDENDDDED